MDMEFERNVLLSKYSNYCIGGPADFFSEPESIQELQTVLNKWREINASNSEVARQIFILGGGTNILFPDEGLRGLTVRPAITDIRREGNAVFADAGALMDSLLNFTANEGLSGLEWAGGLPGTLGGAIRGNAGCFGGEIKDVLKQVESVDTRTGEIIKRKLEECAFTYRSSIFKTNKHEVIVRAVLQLKPEERNVIAARRDEHITYRKERHPLEYPNIGSIFKNVPLEIFKSAQNLTEAEVRKRFLVKDDPFPVVPAARLIGEAGLKGKLSGGAKISEKHANFIVNFNNATASDVKELIAIAKKNVFQKFSIKLEEEVQVL